MLASDFCPVTSTVSALDLSQPNVSEAWGYTRSLLYQPLTAAEAATYEAQIEDGLITEMPLGTPVAANDGSVKLYSDLMERGMCTTHKSILPFWPSEDPGSDAQGSEDGENGEEDQNGSFLDWLLNTGRGTNQEQ